MFFILIMKALHIEWEVWDYAYSQDEAIKLRNEGLAEYPDADFRIAQEIRGI